MWFGEGNQVDILNDLPDKEYEKLLNKVPGLKELINKYQPKAKGKEELFLMEFALHGLAEYSMLSKQRLTTGLNFKDLLSSMFSMPGSSESDEDEEDFFK